MRGGAGAVLAALGLVFSHPASARERILTPIDDWAVKPSEEYCFLARNFQDPQGKHIKLQLQSFGTAHGVKITLIGDGVPLRSRARGVAKFSFRFNAGADWLEAWGTSGYVNGTDALTFVTHLPDSAVSLAPVPEPRADETPAGEGGAGLPVEQLAVAYPSRDDTVLQLGDMTAPLSSLRQCIGTMMEGWGYDAAALAAIRTSANLTNAREMGPVMVQTMAAVGLRQNDSIHLRLDIDEQGTVASCMIQQPRLSTEAEASLCNALRMSGKFEPARDAAGNPVRAPLVETVVFGFY